MNVGVRLLEIRESDEPWAVLLRRAYGLVDHAQRASGIAIEWSFGGGTVLMFRLRHRRSKDVDIFLPDRQLLGLFSSRISDELPESCDAYSESASAVKLFYPEGEIDFVATATLTSVPFEMTSVLGRDVKLETHTEIVAKKLWHRGATATARDLFDLAAVADSGVDTSPLIPALVKSGNVFLTQLRERCDVLEAQFEAIDVLDYRESYWHCVEVASRLVEAAHASSG